jgi:hypothetical protein
MTARSRSGPITGTSVLIESSLELYGVNQDLNVIYLELPKPPADTIPLLTVSDVHAAKVLRGELSWIEYLRLLASREVDMPTAVAPDGPTREPLNDRREQCIESIRSLCASAQFVFVVGSGKDDPLVRHNSGITGSDSPPDVLVPMPSLRYPEEVSVDLRDRKINVVKPIDGLVKKRRLFRSYGRIRVQDISKIFFLGQPPPGKDRLLGEDANETAVGREMDDLPDAAANDFARKCHRSLFRNVPISKYSTRRDSSPSL